ncbi:MAG: hypothetical protein ACYDHN_03685 [Solirubrobacteraceae bacterium]
MTIHEVQVWWTAHGHSSGGTAYVSAATNNGVVGEAITPFEHASTPDVYKLPSSTTSFTLSTYCANDHEGAACTFSGPIMQLFGAQVTLAESGLPKGSAIGGTLESTNSLTGTQSLSYNVEDPESGVRLVKLQVDGEPAASSDFVAQCAYAGFQACPGSQSGSISWNTATVADGLHSITAVVQDAAQNTSTFYAGSITTHNAPTNTTPPTVLAPSQVVVGSALSAQTGGWSAPTGAGAITYAYQWQDCDSEGNSCHAIPGAQNASYTPAPSDAGHALRVLVSAADNDGMSSATSNPTATVQSNSGSLGAPNGPGGTNPTSGSGSSSSGSGGGGASGSLTVGVGAPNGTVASEATLVHLGVAHAINRPFAKRAFKLAGRLTTTQGLPIAGASLDLLEEVSGSSHLRLLKHAKTSPAGTFSAMVPAGPSRRIEVAYRAYSADPAYAATATVVESVQAGAKLHITPRHTASTGTITLTGKVSGPLPRHGAIVDLLVHYHGRWQPLVRNQRTNSHGKFKVPYKFQGGHGRFPVRVEVPAGQAGFPYTSGYSKIVNVTTS